MPSKVLVYTVAFDPGNNCHSRILAKLLVLSLVRTMSNVDVCIFHNSPAPLFLLPLANVTEIPLPGPQPEGRNTAEYYRECASWRYLARNYLDVGGYEWVLYLDADCLALRPIDHWFTEFSLVGKDVIVVPEYGKPGTLPQFCSLDPLMPTPSEAPPFGLNAGTFAVRSSVFSRFLSDWEEEARVLENSSFNSDRKWADQISFNSVLSKGYSKHFLQQGQVAFPFRKDVAWVDVRESMLIHAAGGNLDEKCKCLFGIYMESFYYDSTGIFLEMLNP